MGTLLSMVRSGRLTARTMATHSFKLGGMMQAYEWFANAAANQVIKVVPARSRYGFSRRKRGRAAHPFGSKSAPVKSTSFTVPAAIDRFRCFGPT